MDNSKEAVRARYEQVKQIRANGKTLQEACAQAGMGANTFYKWEKKLGRNVSNEETKRKPHRFVDLTPNTNHSPSSENVILVVCAPDQIRQILKEIK